MPAKVLLLRPDVAFDIARRRRVRTEYERELWTYLNHEDPHVAAAAGRRALTHSVELLDVDLREVQARHGR